MVKEKPKSKGFKRSRKEWEESIAEHLGKFVDRLSPQDFADMLLMTLIGYKGLQIAYATKKTEDLQWIPLGILGYRLATTMGGTPPVSQIAGLVILGAMGMTSMLSIPGSLPSPPTKSPGEPGYEEELIAYISSKEFGHR